MADDPVPATSAETPPPLPPTSASPRPLRPRRERLPGTYAGNYLDSDPNPTVGGVITAGLFTLVFALEIFRLFTELFEGFTLDADVFVFVRVGLFSLALIVLWVGAAPARWVLAIGAFLFGTGLLVQTVQLGPDILTHNAYAIASMPLAFTYILIFVCLGFSSNVVAFAKGQRAPGKGFSVARIVVLCTVTLGGLAAMRPLVLYWRAVEEHRVLVFAEESVRAISAHWDPAAFDERADPEYVADWPVEAKKAVMHDFSGLGAARSLGTGNIKVRGSFDFSRGLRWYGYYSPEKGIVFEHGGGHINLEMQRGLFTPWRITAWSLTRERYNAPPIQWRTTSRLPQSSMAAMAAMTRSLRRW